jgi:teichuronic acid exporter
LSRQRSRGSTSTTYEHPTSGRSSAAVKGVLWSTVSSGAPALFGMLVFMATSRVLGRADFGIVAFAASIAALGSAILPGGFGEALIQRRLIDQRHLTAVFWVCLASALAIFALICVVAAPIARQMGQPALQSLIPFLGTRVIFDMAGEVPNAILIRTMSFAQMAFRTTVASLVAGVVCVLLLWLGFGVWALAVSQLAAAIVASVGSLFATRWLPSLSFDRHALGELASFGLFATGYRFIGMLSVDQILIGALIGPAGLGIYTFSRRIFQILSDLIAGALSGASYSLLSSLQGDRQKVAEAFLFATFTSSIVSFPVFVGLVLTADQFVPLFFGAHWIEAIPAVQSFSLLGLLTSIGILQSSLIRSQGQANMWFYYLVARQIITIFYVVLFCSWGINALVNAITIETFLMWIPSVQMVAQILRMPILRYLGTFAVPALATLFMFVATTYAKTGFADLAPPLALAATVITGALSYTAFLVLFARQRIFAVRDAVLKRR